VLGTDGSSVYVSGYPNGDYAKPGIYRINAESGAMESLDPRALHGQSFVVGSYVFIAGSAQLEAGHDSSHRGQLVLAVARDGKSTSRIACIEGGYTAHAYAVAGKYLLMSLFKGDGNLASIVKIPLP
jgi:hypothetical protein